jgi:hypothetical protein
MAGHHFFRKKPSINIIIGKVYCQKAGLEAVQRIDDAMLAVYGLIPDYSGRGRPPSRPKTAKDWLYLQMVISIMNMGVC